ncbi:hypothetical protein JXR93_03070 [bacterium]|nr:hypothetical protein [bacterium]
MKTIKSLILLLLISACSGEELVPLDYDIIPEYKKVNITIYNYCLSSKQEFIDIYASNYSAKFDKDRIIVDFDRDGLPNAYENVEKYGTSSSNYDANGDGYRDQLIYLSGIDIENQQYLKLCYYKNEDSDLDGLNDCEEENLTHTDPYYFDTDLDGIPDDLEIRFGLNPNDYADAFSDIDGDGVINSQEVRLNTPINLYNTRAIDSLSYRYNVTLNRVGDFNGETYRCFDVEINNISLLDVSNGNLIRLNIIEKKSLISMMRTFRTIFEYDKIEDNQKVYIDFRTLIEGR